MHNDEVWMHQKSSRHWGTVILQLDIFARVENIQILMTFRHLHSPSNEVYSTPYVGKCGWENLSRYGLTLVWTIFSNTLDVSDMREWFRGQHDSLKGHISKWFAFWKVFILKGYYSHVFYLETSWFRRFLSRRVIIWKILTPTSHYSNFQNNDPSEWKLFRITTFRDKIFQNNDPSE